MRRYVSLSVDAAPTYAALAPVTVRLWKRLGYTAILHIHEDGWGTPFGELVLREISGTGAAIVGVPTVPPLSIPNTMRAVRLVAAAVNGLELDDAGRITKAW
mgnify:CR=1 FL=1